MTKPLLRFAKGVIFYTVLLILRSYAVNTRYCIQSTRKADKRQALCYCVYKHFSGISYAYICGCVRLCLRLTPAKRAYSTERDKFTHL